MIAMFTTECTQTGADLPTPLALSTGTPVVDLSVVTRRATRARHSEGKLAANRNAA